MIVKNIKQYSLLIRDSRVLGLDVSKNRLGLAVSDYNQKLALPVKTIIRSKFIKDLDLIKLTAAEYNCHGLVIGYPVLLSGIEGPRCQAIIDFAKLLDKHLGMPIYLQNEQFSSKIASNDYNYQSKTNDHLAASIFLQDFLDHMIYIKTCVQI